MHKRVEQRAENATPPPSVSRSPAVTDDAVCAAPAANDRGVLLFAAWWRALCNRVHVDRRASRSTAVSVGIHLVALFLIYQWRFPEHVAGLLPQLQQVTADPQERLDAEFNLAEANANPADSVWSTAALSVAPDVSDEVPELSDTMPPSDDPRADIRLARLEPLEAVAAGRRAYATGHDRQRHRGRERCRRSDHPRDRPQPRTERRARGLVDGRIDQPAG
ncbi:MAG: hypothetical protein R3C10_08590 [Pirellulales bacterium]